MTLLLAVASAFWRGILTSVSPCPLASNVAAISYIARDLERPGRVFWSGFLYSLGRVISPERRNKLHMGLEIHEHHPQ